MKKIIVKILQWEARLLLARYKPHIIGVTGSVGKTSTKDAIAAALSSSLHIRKNEKSYNSEFGVPLTILDLKSTWGGFVTNIFGWSFNILVGLWRACTYGLPTSTYFVLEMGADHPGDIASLVKWARPEIGVVTGLGGEVPVHVEFFPSVESLVSEKGRLLEALPATGVAVLNRDDARVWDMRELTRARVVSFGTSADANVKADGLRVSYDASGKPKGISFRVDIDGKSIPVRLCGALGKGHMYAALAALAVANELGVNLLNAVAALEGHKTPPGRLRVLAGINGSTLIDDTYNSSPAAVKVALEVLHELEIAAPHFAEASRGKKIAVLGDMMELGEYGEQEHRKVGGWLPGVADVLVCVGERSKWVGEEAQKDGFKKENIYYFADSVSASDFLKTFVKPNDVVLLKASQSIRLEKATEMLLPEPSRASELLVRQDKEWKKK
ncbi:MAG TPA: UDP-N-acetylmuramoyl-tripeptide--D-alanyl-D-alanine ligase [Candidatus Paceibacterota bacterium]